MSRDLGVDEDPSALPEPRIEDRPWTAAVGRRDPDDELVGFEAALARHRRPAGPRRGRHETQQVELAAVPDRCPVADTAAGGQLGSLPRETVEVTVNPGLALAQETLDQWLGMGPTAASGERDADHETPPRIDRHTEAA